MANDIPTGLRVPSQAPLDYKTYSQSEAALQNLGVDNQLAYTYHKGLRVTCILERTNWEWKEMEVDEVGLLPANFIYPNGLIVEGIDYSNKEYNFFKIVNDSAFQRDENGSAFVRDRNPANYGNLGYWVNDLGRSDTADINHGAYGDYSTIGGGVNNGIGSLGQWATISGGFNNYTNGRASGIGSGANNNIAQGAWYSFIGGGNTNKIFATGTTTGSFIGAGDQNTVLGQFSAIVAGNSNDIISNALRGFIGAGQDNEISKDNAGILGGYTNKASAYGSAILGGAINQTKGDLSSVIGGVDCIADSYGEVVGGTFGTTYTPLSRTNFNSADRIFNIGIGTDSAFRKDGFSVFKNGLATLPNVTNALITAGSVKSIVTKEYLSLYALDANVIHKTGDESGLTGIKTWTNTGATQINGIFLINNGTIGSSSLRVTNSSTGYGSRVDNGGTGTGSIINNTSSGYGSYLTNSSTGFGGYINNTSTGYGHYLINVAGIGSFISNQSAAQGFVINNESTGLGQRLNSTTSSTGDLMQFQKNGTLTTKVDHLGNITAPSFIKSGGTSTQYLMADGSVTTAGATIQQAVVLIPSWSQNTGNVVSSTIGTGKTIISAQPYLYCINSNNGYSVGDITTVSGPKANDSGGLADSGISIRFRNDLSDRFTINVNNELYLNNTYNNASTGTSGGITDPVLITNSTNWGIRIVILYV